ncbi:MAG: hypothetical protein M3O71_09940 [Bacteroidota bacterium]|nr:hypothetical protein [Bacteroidota bacterium]
MKVPADITHTEEMLREAMEMLDDVQRYMGMFQRQRYGKLKRQFDQHESLGKELQTALNGIDTTQNLDCNQG